MLLPDYIEKVGAPQVAKMLGVSRQNVHLWRQLKGTPRLDVAYKLIMVSGGELSFDAIYIPYLKKRFRGKKFWGSTDGQREVQLEFKF